MANKRVTIRWITGEVDTLDVPEGQADRIAMQTGFSGQALSLQGADGVVYFYILRHVAKIIVGPPDQDA